MVRWISAWLPAARAALVMSKRTSDDLEIAGELPIGDVLSELALLPFARRGEMLDERVAEERAGDLRALQPLRRLPQGARQVEVRRQRQLVGVARDRRLRLDLVLDAPQPARERRRERDIGVRVGGGDA